jgi:NhaP-type Na+/H+ or K+/H+ antiporter
VEVLSAASLAAVLALVGLVIVVAALLSGYIEKSDLPQVAVFLGLGAALGPAGLGLLDVRLDSPILHVVATLSLALVLFTDAVSLNIPEARRNSGLALLVLGPGTFLSAALIALAAWWLLGLPPAAAIVLGAALASTDPVLLRGLLRRPTVPRAGRIALRLESGMNDAVLLPIVLVAMLFLRPGTSGDSVPWVKLLLELFLLGPAAGVLVGLLGVATIDLVRRRSGVRRDYESIYSLGLCFAAFAAAESVHGSGFLAAFVAGLTISALDVELCDCFLEYGETTAEMALLFTFVLLGGSLIWSGFVGLTVAAVLFALVSLFIRPLIFPVALLPARIDRKSRFLISWFGPRGLSSLLLVLLPVFADIPGSDRLFSLCSLVVVFSVTLHGGTLTALSRWKDRHPSPPSPEEEMTGSADGTSAVAPAPSPTPPADDARPAPLPVAPAADSNGDGSRNGTPAAAPDETEAPAAAFRRAPRVADPERITLNEVRRLRQAGVPVTLLDVRTERSYLSSDEMADGAIRIDPERAVRAAEARALPKDGWLAAYCT